LISCKVKTIKAIALKYILLYSGKANLDIDIHPQKYHLILCEKQMFEFCARFKNSLIIHEENTKKNHKRVVSLYVDKDFPSFT
jgi:hypothetical protein